MEKVGYASSNSVKTFGKPRASRIVISMDEFWVMQRVYGKLI